MIKYVVESDCKGIRIDVYLNENLKEISRNNIKKNIESGNVKLNGKIPKPSTKVDEGDEIEIIFEKAENEEEVIVSQKILLDIVYEDEDLAVINKKKGMLVHPDKKNKKNTLVNALLNIYGFKNLSNIAGNHRPGIVHRLDKDTTGLIIIAKNNSAHRFLAKHFKDRKIYKKYVFLCNGILTDEIIIDAPIIHKRNDGIKRSIGEEGLEAITKVVPLFYIKNYTYASAEILTGRTHQIRVHMASINHPIVGDKLYSNRRENVNGQLLHSQTIEFLHPKTNKKVKISCNPPKEFFDFIKKNE